MECLQLFCRFTGSVDGKGDPALHHGGEAIRAAVAFCESELSKKPSEDEIKNCSAAFDLLEKYKFMCPPHREADMNKVLKHLVAPKAKAKAKGKAKAAPVASDSAVRSAKAMFDD